jgi:hypothetical protein
VKIHFDAGERAVIVAKLGLPAGVTDDQVQDAVISRLTAKKPVVRPKQRRALRPETLGRVTTEDGLAPPAAQQPTPNPSEEIPPIVSQQEAQALMEASAPGPAPSSRRPSRAPDSVECEELITAAIAAGKFPQERAKHYRHRYNQDPPGTVEYIGRMTGINPAFYDDPGEGAGASPDAYPKEWLGVAANNRFRTTGGD